MNYKDSGVNIEAGNAFVQRLKQKVPSIGGFNGMFEIPSGYEQPVLVSSTDGVGTVSYTHLTLPPTPYV